MSTLGLTVWYTRMCPLDPECARQLVRNEPYSLCEMCPSYLCSSICLRMWKDSLLRELLICHSTINAHVSRVRLRGHDLWFPDATCKYQYSIWVPSALRVSWLLFSRSHRCRWFDHDVWESNAFDQKRLMREHIWSGPLFHLISECLYVKDCTGSSSLSYEELRRRYK